MNTFKGRSLCVIDDFTKEERLYLFSQVKKLKEAVKRGDKKTLDSFRINDPDYGIYEVFLEDSTRTKESFRNAIAFHHAKLTEMSADMDQIHYVIVGIGINVQMTDFPKEIQNTATSLKLETGKTLLRNELLAKVLEEFEVLYEQFVSAESLKNLKAEYESRLANKDNRVNVLAPSGAWQGICLGIKEDGALLVQREDGKVEEVIAGEVSVRGIYGYV